MYHDIRTVLYHGTVSEIGKVDVKAGRNRKDFGQGFYMSVTRQQAVGMMHKKYREAIRRSRNKNANSFSENLYEIQLDGEQLKELNIKCFDEASMEWLDFVLLCREQGGMPHDYDLVIGATADDDTALCLKAYEEGLYGKKGSLEARQILLRNLEVENLGIQYYIGKQDVADRLITRIRKIEWR